MSNIYNFKVTCPAVEKEKRFTIWEAMKSGPLTRRILVGEYNLTGHTSYRPSLYDLCLEMTLIIQENALNVLQHTAGGETQCQKYGWTRKKAFKKSKKEKRVAYYEI